MDFTGFTIEDHYRAVVQERERLIKNSAWRRKVAAARRENTAACCDAFAADSQRRREQSRASGRPAPGVS